jgi:hypothetical protein
MTLTGKIDRTALFRAVGSWIFNYNTVESTMLFCSVIICLMGIMYQSTTIISGNDSSGRDAITGVIMSVMVVSITYLASVFGIEIYIAMNNNKTTTNKHIMRSSKDEKSIRNLSSNSDIPDISTSETNPLMVSNTFKTQFNIDDFTDPPPAQIWAIFRQMFSQQSENIKDLTTENLELKKYKQTHVEIELTPLQRHTTTTTRKEFGPPILAGYRSASLQRQHQLDTISEQTSSAGSSEQSSINGSKEDVFPGR